jgi:tight adherence protein B
MNFLTGLLSNTTFLLAVVAVFATATLLWYVALVKGREFMESYEQTFTETASTNLADMFSFMDATRLFYINVAALVIIPVLILIITRDWLVTVAAFAVLLLVPNFLFRRMRNKRLRRFEQQLPDGLQMISGSMRAGASLNIALESLVKEQGPPLSQEFALFLREQRIGVDFETSLANLEKRVPVADFGMVLSALRINREVGGNLAEVLEALGETLRRKHTMEGKIDSLTAQGKLQGIVMTALPILLAVLLNFLEPEAMSKLWTEPIGWAVLTVIIVMESLGYFMIRKITSIDV